MPKSLADTVRAANHQILVEGNLAAIPDFFAPDYVAHGTEAEVRGPAGVQRFVGMVLHAFEDLDAQVEILLEGSDRVAWQRTLRGTQSGAFLGFPASGRDIIWRDMIVSRFDSGTIAEDWVVTDLAERLLRARKP